MVRADAAVASASLGWASPELFSNDFGPAVPPPLPKD
jgi:hypothetical protein